MYNNSYSHSKLGLSAKKIHRAKGKSCGYYMRIVFFFSSLIQTLIIISLVLFLVYGQPDQSAAEKRLQSLDPMHNDLKFRHGYLRDEFRNLSWNLNMTNRDMEFIIRNFTRLQNLSSTSVTIIKGLQTKLFQCQMSSPPPCNCPRMPSPSSCQSNGQVEILQQENRQLKSWLQIVQKNFSDTSHFLRLDLENAKREQESLLEERVMLREAKFSTEREIELFKEKCKGDFIKSLAGIPEITRAFRERIDTVFPQMIPFHITCQKQSEHLEQIQNNCSSLSREVENKFQPYLDNIGTKVSNIVQRMSHLQAKRVSLEKSFAECKQNLTYLQEQQHKMLSESQYRHDRNLKDVLLEQRKLREAKKLADDALQLQASEISILKEKINNSLASCGHKLSPAKPAGGSTGSKMGSNSFPPGSGKPTSGALGTSSVPGSSSMGINTGAFSSGANHGMSRTNPMATSGADSASDRFRPPATHGRVGSTGTNTLSGGSYNSLSLGTESGRTGTGGTGPGSGTLGSVGMGSGSYGTGSSRTGPGSMGPGANGNLGSGGMVPNTGSYGTESSRAGTGSTGTSSSGNLGSSGTGPNTGSFGTGSSSRTGVGGTGPGSFPNLGSGGMGPGTGSFGTGSSSRTSSGSMGPGSFGNLGSVGTGPNTGSFGTGSSSRTGVGGTGPGSFPNLGSGGMGAGSFGTGSSSRTGSGSTGPGSFGNLGSGGTGPNTGSSGTGSNSRMGGGGPGPASFPNLGSGGMGPGTGSFGTGSSSRTGVGGTGPGSFPNLGSGGMGAGSFGTGSSSRTGSGSTGPGSFGNLGSGGNGPNTGSFGTGSSSRTGGGGTGPGSFGNLGPGGTGSFGTGSSRTGSGSMGPGSYRNSGSTGMGSSSGSYGTGSSSRTGSGSTGPGSFSTFGQGGMGSNTGSYGAGSIGAGTGGFGSRNSFSSGGFGRSGHGGGSFGSVDPVEAYMRELQELLNLRVQ